MPAASFLPSAESPAEPVTKPRKRTPRAKPGAAEAPPAPADSGEGPPEPAAPKRRTPRRKAAETAQEEQEA
jgi:hypothetical protein